ncbi:MAG TPA: CHAT domain-containing protein [Aliidongia sp.]|uniref:CHAT domain-containing protein n=1 Tax=Aliidongia sp. TaxID=1914230 RepID=UPI002DDCCBE7|nr:CHAT domain-containing protein [Aliidongia sp.]HEV2676014.1 CHAT domain-containing protein [Aliidongia sp.]
MSATLALALMPGVARAFDPCWPAVSESMAGGEAAIRERYHQATAAAVVVEDAVALATLLESGGHRPEAVAALHDAETRLATAGAASPRLVGYQASLALANGQGQEAIALLRRVLTSEQAFDVGRQACYFETLGTIEAQQGDLGGAEADFAQAEKRYVSRQDAHDAALIELRINQAELKTRRGAPKEALALLDKVDDQLGSISEDLPTLHDRSAEARASALFVGGQFDPALAKLTPLIDTATKHGNPGNVEAAQSLFELVALRARIRAEKRDFQAAERDYKTAFDLYQHNGLAGTPTGRAFIRNLASYYSSIGRPDLALSVQERLLASDAGRAAIAAPEQAEELINIGYTQFQLREFPRAKDLFARALGILKPLGPSGELMAANAYMGLGMTALEQRDPAKSIEYFKVAFDRRSASLPADSPLVTGAMLQLAHGLLELLSTSGSSTHEDRAAILSLLTEVVARRGGDKAAHKEDLVEPLLRLSEAYDLDNQPGPALEQAQRAADLIVSQRRYLLEQVGNVDAISGTVHEIFLQIIAERQKLGAAQAGTPAALFDSFQNIDISRTGLTISRRAGQAVTTNPDIARAVDEKSQLERRLRDINMRMARNTVVAASAADDATTQAADATAQSYDQILQQLDKVTSRLKSLDPHNDAGAGAINARLPDVQQALKPDEALVMFGFGLRLSFALVVDAQGAHLAALPTTKADLVDRIGKLRKSVSAEQGAQSYCLQCAYELYQKIVAPWLPLVKNAKNIVVVPDGPLTSLPLSVLVDTPPAAGHEADYANAAWLLRRFAITYTPSAAAFYGLRHSAQHASAPKPFIGIGDPAIGKLRAQPATRGVADPDSLGIYATMAEALAQAPALPETEGELRGLETILGGTDADLLLGARATKQILLATDLSQYRVLAFATHGLLADDLKGWSGPATPGLLLTPPAKPTREDYGILTSDEIGNLKLNADWIILSACNTAGGDGTPGAEAFTGLTQSFFQAGARSVIATHWAIPSLTAVKITNGTFRRLSATPDMTRGEALRQSELDIATDPATAHPIYWGAFVLMGEGYH